MKNKKKKVFFLSSDSFFYFVVVKSKVVDQDAPKRTKLDGMSRRKKRLYLARQD